MAKIINKNIIDQSSESNNVICIHIKANDDIKCKHYSFYECYHDHSYIISHDTKSTISLKEKGEKRVYRLHNDIKKEIVVYQIDNGIIKDNGQKGVKKCDYGLYTEDELLILIELKGSDYKQAIKQITNTTRLLDLNGKNKIKKLLVRTVLSNGRNVPNVTNSDTARLKQLISLYNKGFKDSYIIKATSTLEEQLSIIK